MALPKTDLTITAVRTGGAHVAYLRKNLLRAIELIRAAPQEISIALVGNRQMAELHERFLGIPGPTDVLTFELDHDARGRVSAGEIVVCVPYATREAGKRRHTVRQELLLYALHGVLHLSGYDDRNDVDYRRMHRKEDAVLTQLGIGPVFNAAG